jgi:uncharacterized protein
MITLKNHSFIFLILIAFFCRAQARAEESIQASFDCKKATTSVEKKICSSASYAELDRLLSVVYNKKLKSLEIKLAEQESIKLYQKNWLKSRNECLGKLPVEEDQCFYNSYESRIKELGGVDDLFSLYRNNCKKENWSCYKVGNLDIELGRWSDAVKDLTDLCKADYDGDMGESCYKKAFALEHLGKKAEALEQMKKTCNERHNNEACAGAYRLEGKKSSNPWVGLYKNDAGTLFVSEKSNNIILMNADTHWANGHYCGWTKTGTIQNNKFLAEKDSEAPGCLPIIEKIVTKIKIHDPNMACKYAYCGARALFENDFDLDSSSGP